MLHVLLFELNIVTVERNMLKKRCSIKSIQILFFVGKDEKGGRVRLEIFFVS